MAAESPILSIIIIVGNSRPRAGLALQSVLAQAGLEKAEVLLIDAGQGQLERLAGSDHPNVRLLPLPARPLFGHMRAEAVHAARGRYVAFLEEHCVALPGWLKAIVAALDGDWVGVGGEGHTANPGRGISDLVALANYPRWRPPARPGISRMLPGQNSAYHRERLLAFGDDLPALLHSEAILQWRLTEQGYKIGIDPAMKFAHLHETGLGSASRGLHWYCRCFGHTHARLYRWPLLVRWWRAALTPLIPAVRLGRHVLTALRERPQDLPLIARGWPALVWLDACSAAGMAAGYVWGAGDAERRFTDYELDEHRD